MPKEKKNECDGKTTNLVVAKKKGGNRLTSIIFYECPPYYWLYGYISPWGSSENLYFKISKN